MEELGDNKYGTVLVHSSFKTIGQIDGEPDTVLDSLSDYIENGLLVLPTHTWSYINKEDPNFYVDESPSSSAKKEKPFEMNL